MFKVLLSTLTVIIVFSHSDSFAADWNRTKQLLGNYEIIEFRISSLDISDGVRSETKRIEVQTPSGPSCKFKEKFGGRWYEETVNCAHIGRQTEFGSTYNPLARTCDKFNIVSFSTAKPYNKLPGCRYPNDDNYITIYGSRYSVYKKEGWNGSSYDMSIDQNSDETLTVRKSSKVRSMFGSSYTVTYTIIRKISDSQ